MSRQQKKHKPGGWGQSTAELAGRLGLSRWAVSRALNGRGGVSAETVRRVHEALARGEVSPSLLARGLRAGGSGLAGIALPDPETFYLAGKLGLMAGRLTGRGLEPVFRVTDGTADSERRALVMFAAIRCAVVVVFAARLGRGDAAVQTLEATGSRVIHIDPVIRGLKVDAVAADRASAMRKGVEYLHGCGHRSAAVAGITTGGVYGGMRWKGMRAAARKLGWAEPTLIPTPEGTDEFEEGARCAEVFFGHPGRTRAVIARNDRLAMGFLARARELGFHCPEDYSIIGYDNAPLSAHTDPPLTTIDPNHTELILRAAELLHEPVPSAARRSIAPAVVARESCAPPP